MAIMAACTAVSALLHAPFDLGNVVAVYLLGVMLAAAWLGRGPAVAASVLGALAVDFLFVPPVFSFVPEQAAHLLTFVVMLIVAVTVGTMAARLREQLQDAREREQRMATLYGLARDLARAADAAAVAGAVAHHVRERFHCRAILLTKAAAGDLHAIGAEPVALDAAERQAARLAIDASPATAAGAAVSATAARGFYLPMTTGKGIVGVLGLLPEIAHPATFAQQRVYLDIIANQSATALERTQLADAAQRAAVDVEQERLRSTLLSSVSHDLRTPIATIIGASSALLREPALDPKTHRELIESINQEGGRLERQVRNLLSMTRLEAGTVRARCEWTPVEDVVGAALTRLEDALRGRQVITRLDTDLPPVPMDGMLIEQVMLNLIENVLRHTPAGSPIEIAVTTVGDRVQMAVADRGPGIALDAVEHIFEKFHCAADNGGCGLGLAICRAIMTLHGGSVVAANRPGGGALFTVTLSLLPPPSLPPLDRAGGAEGES